MYRRPGFILFNIIIYVALLTLLSFYVFRFSFAYLAQSYRQAKEANAVLTSIPLRAKLERICLSMPTDQKEWLHHDDTQLLWRVNKTFCALFFQEEKLWFFKGIYNPTTAQWHRSTLRSLLASTISAGSWKLSWQNKRLVYISIQHRRSLLIPTA